MSPIERVQCTACTDKSYIPTKAHNTVRVEKINISLHGNLSATMTGMTDRWMDPCMDDKQNKQVGR